MNDNFKNPLADERREVFSTDVRTGFGNSPGMGIPYKDLDAFDTPTRLDRAARAKASARMLFGTDISKLDEPGASALYQSVTEGIFGLPDTDGSMAFGKRAAKDPKVNIDMLRRFCKGEYSLIEDPEYTKWKALDDEGKFQYALKNEGAGEKTRSWFKNERGAGFLDYAKAFFSGPVMLGAPSPILQTSDDAVRRSDYDKLNDEEKSLYRADVIGDYEKKLSRRQVLANFLQVSQGLSDRAGYLLAKSFSDGTPDINIETLEDDERDRVYSAFSMMRGDQKRGRILGIPTDFTDDTAMNRVQLGLYGLQQSVLGLATDTGALARDVVIWAYAKTALSETERDDFFKSWDATVRAELALKQGLPEADTFVGEAWQGVMENLHWFIPYSGIGKGKALMKGARGAKKLKAEAEIWKAGKAAAEAGAEAIKTSHMLDLNGVQKLGEYGRALLARQMASVERYTQKLKAIDKELKLATNWRDASGAAMWSAGEMSAFSAFAGEYVASADAAGISREDSILTAAAIGLINARIERLYVPGLESSLAPAQVKSLTFQALAQAVKSDGAKGFRAWVKNRLVKGVTEGTKVAVTEGLIEEPLQQLAQEHGKAFDKLCAELRANGEDTLANEAKTLFQSLLPNLPADYKTYIDTAADTFASSAGFGFMTIGNMTRRQAYRNFKERRASGNNNYDEGIADVIQRAINTKTIVENYWREDGAAKDGAESNPNRFQEAITAARRAFRNPQTGDYIREIAQAAEVDIKTAEVLAQYLQIETEAATFSPQVRAFRDIEMSLADLDESTIASVMPGYIQGSYLADTANGIYSGRVRLADGTERTIAYRIGDFSQDLRADAAKNAALNSAFGKSFDVRHAEMGDGQRWAALSDAQRYQTALDAAAAVNGYATGAGVFEMKDKNGETVRVNADDVIRLSTGRLADIGYGAAATQATVRHETFHSLWRFARASLDDADVQSLAKALGVDITAEGWEVTLDETMAHQLERYASGHYVAHAVSSRFDKMIDGWAGNAIRFFGRFGMADEVKDIHGKAYTLKNFYDRVLRGELGSGKLGVELAKIAPEAATPAAQPGAAATSTIPVDVTDADRAAQEAAERAAMPAEEPETAESPTPTPNAPTPVSANTPAPVIANEAKQSAATLENPADASQPNQRFYRIGLPNSPVKIVGHLEVVDAATGLVTSTDEAYGDRGNQNRDDTSEESRALVEKIGANPDPLQLGTVQPVASNGVAWMLPNRNIIIGNHRMNGVRLAYAKGTAASLEKFVREDAAKRDIEIPESVKKPVTVFVLDRIESPDSKDDIHEVVRLANESQNRGFNVREQAGNDAKILLDRNLLPRITFRPDGRIDETKSGEAIGVFRQESGAQGMIAEDGSLTEEGQTRLQNAALAALLGGTGSTALLQKILANTKRLGMANELRSLMKVTPELMAIAREKPPFDIRDALADALQLFTEWRDKDESLRLEKGKSKHDWYKTDKDTKKRLRGLSWEAFMSQGDMFRSPSPEAKILGDLFARAQAERFFDREDIESEAGKKRAIDLIANYLSDYIANARAANTEVDMFGTPPASRADILDTQRAKGIDGPRFSVAPVGEGVADYEVQYAAVVARYTNKDGTKKPGWMRAPNGKPTNLTERQWVQVRTPAFKDWFGDWEAVAELTAHEIASISALKEKLSLLRGLNLLNVSTGIIAQINATQQNKMVSNAAARKSEKNGFLLREHNAAVGIVDSLWKHARLVLEREDESGDANVKSVKRFVSPVIVGGKQAFAYLTAKESVRDGHRLYSVELAELKTLEQIIAEEKRTLKGKLKGLEEKHLSASSVGDMLANVLESVNGVSKVVDENGEPKVVYHRTNNDFTQFDKNLLGKKSGWRTAYLGFYFASRDVDGSYGKISMPCFLNIKSPEYIQVKYYSDFDYDYKQANPEDFAGKDGIEINATEVSKRAPKYNYVAFNPNQIKSATDNTGAFDGSNPDIRFSMIGEGIADYDAQYAAVVARYTNKDGTKKPGWMRAPNGKPTNLTERQWVQVRTPAFKDWFGDWEAVATMPTINDGLTLASLREQFGNNGERFTSKGETFVNEESGVNAKMSGVAYRKMTSNTAVAKSVKNGFTAQQHNEAVVHIKKLFENAHLLVERGDRDGNPDILAIRRFAAPVRVNGEIAFAWITTKEAVERGNRVYSLEMVELKKLAPKLEEDSKENRLLATSIKKPSGILAPKASVEGTQAESPRSASLGSRIANFISRVNGANVSKVVDENGEPKVVYHGTDADFTVFDPTKSRANMDIQGSFFSPWEIDSSGYGGNVLACFLNIRNPANETQGYKALSTFKGQNGAGIKARELLKEQGFDGVNNESEEYIAFSPNQIKSATDNTGAFDAQNADIRYSVVSLEEGVKLSDLRAEDGIKRLIGRILKNKDSGFSATFSQTSYKKLVSVAAMQKSVHNGFTKEQHNAAVANIKELYEKAYLLVERADKGGDPNIKAIRRFATPVMTTRGVAVAWITTKESVRDGNRMYSVEMIELKTLAPKIGEVSESGNRLQAANVNNKVANILAEVNRENDDIRFSVSPTLGDDIEKAFTHEVKSKATIPLCNEPIMFGKIGLPHGDIVTKAYAIRKLRDDHKLNAAQIVENVKALEDPLFILKDGKDAVIILTGTMAKNKQDEMADIMAAIHLKKEKAGEHYLASLYPLDDLDKIKNKLRAKGLVYSRYKKDALEITTADAPGISPDLVRAVAEEGDWENVITKDDIAQEDREHPPQNELADVMREKAVETVLRENILSGDDVRATMPGYDPGDWHTHVDRTGYVAERMNRRFEQLLETRRGKGERSNKGVVVFLAGGNGAGKSTVSSDIQDTPDFVIDSTLGNLEVARMQINRILANGQKPHIYFVYRTPEQALKNIQTRIDNGGHTVSPLSFADSHTKSLQNLPLLVDEFGDKILVDLFDFSGGEQKKITLDELKKKGIPDHGEIRAKANLLRPLAGSGQATSRSGVRIGEKGVRKSGSKERPNRYSLNIDGPGAVYPQFVNTISDDELIVAAVASKMALGTNEKSSSRSVTINAVQRMVARIHPDWDRDKQWLESTRIYKDAQKFSKRIKSDIERGVSDSLILEHLPESARETFGDEMRQEARAGQRLGTFGTRVRAELKKRQARIVETAVRVQTGIDADQIENTFGINLADTIMKLAEKPLREKKDDTPPVPSPTDDGQTAGDPAAAEPTLKDIDVKVQAVVDDILAASGEDAARDEANRKNSRDAERQAEAAAENGDETRDAGEDFGGNALLEAVRKHALDLESPRHLAHFIAELARRQWIKEHGLPLTANVWQDLVAVQFLRKTAQSVYTKLVKDLTYSRSRETAMSHVLKLDAAPTVAGLMSEMEFLGALINSSRIRETQQQKCEQLDKFLREHFSAQGRFKPDKEEGKRKVSAEAELWARYMRHAMWLTPEAAANESGELARTLESLKTDFKKAERDVNQSREFVETVRKLNVLREFGSLRYKPLGEIDAAIQWWEDFERGASDDIMREMSDREIRTTKAAHLLAVAFTNPKAKTVKDGSTLSDRVGNFLTGHMGFHSLVNDCLRFASEQDRAAVEKIVDYIFLEIQKAGDRTASEKRRQNDAFYRAVETIYDKGFNAVMKEMTATDEDFLPFMGEVGGKRVIPTKGRAMQLLVSLLQEGRPTEVDDEEHPGKKKTVWVGGYHDNIVRHKREGQARQLMAMMTPEDLNMIKWLGAWYKQNRADLSQVCHGLFGIGVYAESSNYFPVKMMIEKQGLEKGSAVGWSIFPKALTPRVKNERDFDTSADIFQMWASRMEEGAQWKHHAQLGLEMRGIFGRSELQSAVIASHGNHANDLMQSFITDILAGQGAIDRTTGGTSVIGDEIRGWTALCALGGNVGVMFKQTTSIPAFGFEIGLVNTAKHMVTAFTPEGMAAMAKIWNSEQRKTRWDVGSSEAVQNALNRRDAGVLKRLFQASMITNKIGDAVPTLVVGQGIYRDLLEQGMSKEDAMAEMWSIAERTQQSGRMENQINVQRRNKLGRTFYQFLSTNNQMLQYETRAIRELMANPTAVKRWGKLGRVILLNHVILTSAYFWMGELYKACLGQEPPEDQLKDWVISCLLGSWGSLMVLGFMCKATLDRAIKGYSFGRGSSMLPMEGWMRTQINDGAKLTEAIFSAEGDTWDEMVDAAAKWMSDLNSTVRDLRKIYRFRIKDEPQ